MNSAKQVTQRQACHWLAAAGIVMFAVVSNSSAADAVVKPSASALAAPVPLASGAPLASVTPVSPVDPASSASFDVTVVHATKQPKGEIPEPKEEWEELTKSDQWKLFNHFKINRSTKLTVTPSGVKEDLLNGHSLHIRLIETKPSIRIEVKLVDSKRKNPSPVTTWTVSPIKGKRYLKFTLPHDNGKFIVGLKLL